MRSRINFWDTLKGKTRKIAWANVPVRRDTSWFPEWNDHLLSHPEGSSNNVDKNEHMQKFWFWYTMEVYEKNYFERCRRAWRSWALNYILEMLYISSRSELRFAFLDISRDASDIGRCWQIFQQKVVRIIKNHVILFTSCQNNCQYLKHLYISRKAKRH